MIKVGVLGARGRMGREASATVEGAPDTELFAQVDQGDSLDALIGCDVVVDFTHVAAVMGNLRWCVEHGLERRGGHLRLRRRPAGRGPVVDGRSSRRSGCSSRPTSRSGRS